jgi:uncharacterized protein YdeI (YjbR/CyaY-like superfamily)
MTLTQSRGRGTTLSRPTGEGRGEGAPALTKSNRIDARNVAKSVAGQVVTRRKTCDADIRDKQENHDREQEGIWLVYDKRKTCRPSLDYEESVEEALCSGSIDSIIKRIDDQRYCRKFTPRKDASAWSTENKRRAEKMIQEGSMTESGRAKVDAAKRSGRWDLNPRVRQASIPCVHSL